LQQFFAAMLEAYGPQGWWPGHSRPEIIIGAVLTQNTSWKNVEKAIAQLKAEGLLDWQALGDVSHDELARCIRSAGYHNVKAKRLKNFVRWLWQNHDGALARLADIPLDALRRELLTINGIGAETADAILLYALDRPTFVIDAYTARIARRHGLIDADADGHALKTLFEDHLPADVALFNEYHALLVEVGKRHCKPTARCEGCPLEAFEHNETV